MLEFNNVLVATDFGEASDAALQCGRQIARTFGATLHVLNIVDDVYARGLEGEPLEGWAEQQRALQQSAVESLRRRVTAEDTREFDERPAIGVSAHPADAIVQYAREISIDLIVMGTHGRGAVDPLDVGSVSARVVHAAPCPVLTVKRASRIFASAAIARGAAAE